MNVEIDLLRGEQMLDAFSGKFLSLKYWPPGQSDTSPGTSICMLLMQITHLREIKTNTYSIQVAKKCSQSSVPLPVKSICKLLWPKQFQRNGPSLSHHASNETGWGSTDILFQLSDVMRKEHSMNIRVFLWRMGLKAVASLFAMWLRWIMGTNHITELANRKGSITGFQFPSPSTSRLFMQSWQAHANLG